MPQNHVTVEIDTVIIFTANMQSLANFYRQGFELGEPQASGNDHVGFVLPHLYLGFDQVSEEHPTPGGISIWFRVNDLDGTFERLVGLGANVRYAPVTKPFGERLASVYDPDGNLIGIAERQP